MRIVHVRTIAGPNVYYAERPVIEMRLDLEDLAGRESREFAGFNGRLLAALPGLREHHRGLGRTGGFVERLEGGTYFGHIVEHVALELTDAAGIPVNHGKTRESGEAGVYNVAVSYRNEAGMRCLLETAVEFVKALLDERLFPLDEHLEQARAKIAETTLGPSTRALVQAAELRGIPWRCVDDRSTIQLGYGKHRKFIEAALTSGTSCVAVDIAGNKELTKRILREANIPVPNGRVARSRNEAEAAFAAMRAPVVVRPLDSCPGRGVLVELRTAEQVRHAFEIASEESRSIIVEEQLEGNDYRVLVVAGKVIAASQRTPAHMVGDGRHTIAQRIELRNEDPRRGEGHLSRGGEARDVTEHVHPSIARMCERAARVIGLDVCGVDLVAEDISQPLNETGGIVEVNASPGLGMHLFPTGGEPRDVASPIIESMYPAGQNGRIPIVSVTGTKGKTTTTRLISYMLTRAGYCTGTTTTDGIYIAGECVARGDMTGPAPAQTVLADPSVDAAVLETARGGIIRRGLGYDFADVAVLTNIEPAHIGQDGIRSIDDVLEVQKLVARRLRHGGTLVLNCDDPKLAALPSEEGIAGGGARIVYFTLRPHCPQLRWHLAQGNTGFFVENGWIMEGAGPARWRIIPAADVPITLGGLADFQTANVLAAVAAARALGVGAREIRTALTRFDGVVRGENEDCRDRLAGRPLG